MRPFKADLGYRGLLLVGVPRCFIAQSTARVQAALCQSHPWAFLMSSTEMIRTFLVDRLGVEPDLVQPASLLADLGVDSLMLAELMFEAEDRMGIDIPSDIEPPKTVAEMLAVIDALVASKTT